MNKQVIAIGDCHGCYNTLVALVDKIKSKYPDGEIVFCGDLVDRGPRSMQVVQYVIDNGYKCVQGNHEAMMYTDLNSSPMFPNTWTNNGGIQTKDSYQFDDKLMQKHADWMRSLPTYIIYEDVKNVNNDKLVISHSSIQDFWEYRDNNGDNIMWNRNPVSEEIGKTQGIYNIFGHTPNSKPIIKNFYANIDTGCVFNRGEYNKLTALSFPSMEVIQQENIE